MMIHHKMVFYLPTNNKRRKHSRFQFNYYKTSEYNRTSDLVAFYSYKHSFRPVGDSSGRLSLSATRLLTKQRRISSSREVGETSAAIVSIDDNVFSPLTKHNYVVQ